MTEGDTSFHFFLPIGPFFFSRDSGVSCDDVTVPLPVCECVHLRLVATTSDSLNELCVYVLDHLFRGIVGKVQRSLSS